MYGVLGVLHVADTHIIKIFYTHNTSVGFTPIIYLDLYTSNTYVGYTPVLHLSNMYITGVLHMYYMCMNYMYTYNTTHVIHVLYTCNIHVAYLVVY